MSYPPQQQQQQQQQGYYGDGGQAPPPQNPGYYGQQQQQPQYQPDSYGQQQQQPYGAAPQPVYGGQQQQQPQQSPGVFGAVVGAVQTAVAGVATALVLPPKPPHVQEFTADRLRKRDDNIGYCVMIWAFVFLWPVGWIVQAIVTESYGFMILALIPILCGAWANSLANVQAYNLEIDVQTNRLWVERHSPLGRCCCPRVTEVPLNTVTAVEVQHPCGKPGQACMYVVLDSSRHVFIGASPRVCVCDSNDMQQEAACVAFLARRAGAPLTQEPQVLGQECCPRTVGMCQC